MKTRSAKNKGQRLQKQVVSSLRNKFCLDLNEETDFDGDISARQMGGSGVDIILSPHAKTLIPFDIECKNTEKTSVWNWILQAEENTKKGRIPLVVFKRNRSKTYAIIEFDKLIGLL